MLLGIGIASVIKTIRRKADGFKFRVSDNTVICKMYWQLHKLYHLQLFSFQGDNLYDNL